MKLIGDGGPLTVIDKGGGGSPIPSRNEIIKDVIKWFGTEYGLDLAESAFQALDTEKLQKWAKERAKQKRLASGGGGNVALLLLAFVAFGSKKKGRRR